MLNAGSRAWLLGGWLASVIVLVGASVAIGANLSTSVLFLAMGLAPAVIMVLIAGCAPPRTVAELLHSVEAKNSR